MKNPWGAGPLDLFICPHCGWTSPNPNDIREKYCANCHWWTGVPELYKPWAGARVTASEAVSGARPEQTA